MRKKLGVVPYVFARPLVHGLGEAGSKFELEYADPVSVAVKMRERSLDVAFLSPIDYALNSPDYSIIPGIGASSPSADRSVLLAFQQGLQKIKSVAVANASTSEVVMTRILLAEKYEVNPTFVPLPSTCSLTVEAMLRRADAALIAGDESTLREDSIESALDLTEEWSDLSDLPFVHEFWVVRSNMLTKEELRMLQESKERGVNELDNIATEAAKQVGIAGERVTKLLTSLVFDLDEEDVESLLEFF
ncbi:MAG: MqnA/MqnD/SBP family protein [Bacteroidota bacterium]